MAAGEAGPYPLKDVPDWFVTPQQIDIWYDGNTVTMMRLLNGTKVIKNGRPKKPQGKRTLTHCLAPIKVLGLVYVRR